MPRRWELTWDKTNKRWKKYYKGRQYYFPFGSCKADRAGYLQALEAWRKKKAEIDGEEARTPLSEESRRLWEAHLERLREGMERLKEEDTYHNRDAWLRAAEAVQETLRKISEGVNHPVAELMHREHLPGKPNRPLPEKPPGKPPWEDAPEDAGPEDTTIAGNVGRFLERKKEQVERGERSHGRYDALRVALESFTTFAGGHKPVESIDSQLLARWRDHLGARAASGEMSLRYAKDHLQAAKQFAGWCWEMELIEYPRILKSREFVIAVPEQTVEVFTVDEVRRLIEGAGEALRLHLLLMLNCGMQQSDIAELRHSEVDWEAGRIERKRSKTKKHKNVPKVLYQLWPETFELLKAHRSDHPELVLTNRNGSPLLVQRIVEGKVKKTDNIRSAYRRLVAKLANGDPPVKIAKPMKHLRKTAASKLGEHPEYARYAQHFLGHAPATVADRHYVRPSQEQFDKALQWLRRELLGA